MRCDGGLGGVLVDDGRVVLDLADLRAGVIVVVVELDHVWRVGGAELGVVLGAQGLVGVALRDDEVL